MTCSVHQRLVIGVVDTIEAKSIDVWLSQEHPTLSFLSYGADIPSVLFSRLHPENFLYQKSYIIHDNGGSARTIISLPKQTTFRMKRKLKSSFLNYLKSFKASKEDIEHLVVFMLGLGTEDGRIKIGSKKMGKDELEKALRRFQGKVTLIIIVCDRRPKRWDIITLERLPNHTSSSAFFGPAHDIFSQTDSQESFEASYSLPSKQDITDRLNDLDNMNMCIRNYACSRIDLFDRLGSVSTSETSSVPPHLRPHHTFGSILEQNTSRMHAKFTSPKSFSVETIDGFLATRNRVIT